MFQHLLRSWKQRLLVCCFLGVLLPNHIHWDLFDLLGEVSYHNMQGLFLGVCCISIVRSFEMRCLLMGSSPIVKLVLKEILFWWQCLVEMVGGSSLILGKTVVVFNSVGLEGPVMPVSLWDQVLFLVLRRLFHKR